MSEHVHTASDKNFETEVLKSDMPILVDFWAEWCQPCKMISPIVEAIAEKYVGRIKVFKLNIDKNAQTPTKYNVRGIPSLVIFRNGEVVDRKVGALNKSQLTDFLNENLQSS